MTFEEWVREFYGYEEAGTVSQELCWDAAQQAEREKYQELIAAAEAIVMTQDIYGGIPTNMIYRMRDVIEKLKEHP